MSCLSKRSDSPIKVKLVGGIGNQLFEYYLGVYLSQLHKTHLELDITDITNNLGPHDVSIESLSVDSTFTKKRQIPKLFIRIFNRLTKITFFSKYSTKHYFSPVVGFDKEVANLVPGTKIHGYFQTYKYFAECSPLSKDLYLVNPSTWFKNMEKEISTKGTLGIHIRRGDYVDLENLYGLLSLDFYISAIKYIENNCKIKSIWIFSDDLHAAKSLFSKISDSRFIWIDPNSSTDPVESLILLSKANAIITANSTFSWWSASLSKSASIICCPDKWYKGMDDPEDLIPSEWYKIKSSWL